MLLRRQTLEALDEAFDVRRQDSQAATFVCCQINAFLMRLGLNQFMDEFYRINTHLLEPTIVTEQMIDACLESGIAGDCVRELVNSLLAQNFASERMQERLREDAEELAGKIDKTIDATEVHDVG